MKNIMILIFGIFIISSCGKENAPCPSDFVVYGEVIPYVETYKLGDTLTLQTVFSKNVYEKSTEKSYELNQLKIESVFYISCIDSTSQTVNGHVLEYVDTLFDNKYNSYIQNFSDGNSSLFSNILDSNDFFVNRLQIVFKRKGIFMLTYGPFSIENKMEFEGKCNNTHFNLNTILNNGKDNNINLLKLSPNDHYNTWILQDPEQRFYHGRFAYRVID